MAHLYVFTVGPVGLRVKVTKESVFRQGGWPDTHRRHMQIEITDPSDVVTTVGVVFPIDHPYTKDVFDEATSAEQAAEYTLEVIKRHGSHVEDTTTEQFAYGKIPGKYAQYLWKLIMPYEIHSGRRRFTSGQAGQGMGSFKMRRLNPSTPPRRNPKIGPDAYSRRSITVPNGYRGVADFYNSTRFVYVEDRQGATRESEVVTRNDAKQIIDLCRARGIHYEMYNADLGPPGLKIPIPARRTRLQQFTTKVNFIVVGRD